MLAKDELKIGIIGLGLIGGSLAKVLAESGYRLTAIAHSESTFEKACQLEIFEKVSKVIDDLDGCSVIFIATPINSINIIFRKLNDSLKHPCIITDVASIKGEITDLAQKIFTSGKITFIPGHPMAGTEHKGIDSSFSDLFKGCRWVLCPLDPSRKTQIDILSSIIEETGAKIVYANPYTHDMAVALISHMPLLVSMGLMESVTGQSDMVLKELALYLAASGFRDTTRIAGGNPELSYDMLKFNEKNVLKALDIFEEALKDLRNALQANKEEVLERFENISKNRQLLYSSQGINIFKGIAY